MNTLKTELRMCHLVIQNSGVYSFKLGSKRKLSNINFQWTKTLYQNKIKKRSEKQTNQQKTVVTVFLAITTGRRRPKRLET